jgi:hypothetical protein
MFLLGTEIPTRFGAKSHQMNGDLDGWRDARSLWSASTGVWQPVTATNGFCECLLTQWTA